MLFNSFPFLFVFLPIVLAGTLLLLRFRTTAQAVVWLGLCSLVFYSYWRPIYFFVIIPSVVANFYLGKAIVGARDDAGKKLWLALGVGLNLGVLAYFKYSGFIANTFSATNVADFTASILNTAMPIGISFYTFQQIAFLADCRSQMIPPRYSFREYLFFVTFFPQLIAGPIVHHGEIIPQLAALRQRMLSRRYLGAYFTPGLALLTIGLVKKVLVADSFGVYADQAFAAVRREGLFGFLDAWGGATAYTFQIYFDFSAYSDMAIGLGLMFGLRMPDNFLSPYKAGSIIEFWRRWHVTLSRFLRDYLYVPLGGNRKGPWRRYLNLLITMALGGLWHGASWSFMAWGLLHGLLLTANHLLRAITLWRPPRGLAVSVTFTIIVFTWLPFRAENLVDARIFFEHMIGLHGVVLPWGYGWLVEALGPLAPTLGLRTGDVNFFAGLPQILLTAAAGGIVFFSPNAVELVLGSHRRQALRSRLLPISLGCGLVVVCLTMLVTRNVTFLYFQF